MAIADPRALKSQKARIGMIILPRVLMVINMFAPEAEDIFYLFLRGKEANALLPTVLQVFVLYGTD